tara:strand:+ start:1261 stop:3183 length:1923 start_codon:yes stop_codon:yes gene_type:complete
VANYNVDLEIAVKGAKELQRSRVGVKLLQKEINKFNKEAKKGSTKVVKSFDNLSEVVGRSKKALNSAAIGTTKYFKAIGKTIDSQKQFNQAVRRQETDFKVVQRLKTKGLEINHKNIQLVRDELAAEIKLARAKKRTAKANLEKGQAGLQVNALRGLGGAVGSGIIGGGFPLLFGQGPTAALGGAIGGVAGGALSAIPGMGQFGFALSIAGTTIGSSLDDLTKSLTKPTENIENLVNRLGLVDTETGDLALELEKLGLKSSAAELLLKEFEREFGLSADQIKENAEKMTEFNNEINKLGTSLTLLLSDVLGPLIKELNQFIMGGKPEGTVRNVTGALDFFTANAFDLDKRGGILDELPPLTNKKSKGLSNIPAGEETVNNPDFGKPGFVIDPNQSAIDLKNRAIQVKEIEPLKQALEIEQNRLNLSGEKLRLMQENFALTNLENELKLLESERTDEVNDALELKIQKLKIAKDTQQQVVENTKALIDPFRQISNIIAQDIGDGIKGLIRGTETLGGLLNNVLNKMADAFLNLGLFGNIGGTFTKGSGLLGKIFKAEGGPVKGGGSYIVGERGPEMFSPGVSGTITPNHKLGGSTNIVVNVDASGSSVEGDEAQGRELGRLISVAVQSELIEQKRPGGILA